MKNRICPAISSQSKMPLAYNSASIAVVYPGFRGWGGGSGRNGGGTFLYWRNKKISIFKTQELSIFSKAMKILQFF